MSVHVLGNANMCPGAESSTIAQVKQIACATEDLQEAVSKDDLLKKVADVNFFSSNSDPRDVVRGVEVLSANDQSLKDRVSDFHNDQVESGRTPYTVSITAYPSKVKKGSCPKKYQTITVGANSMDYRAIPKTSPRRFEVRYNPEKKEFFMCENTNLSHSKRVKNYCIDSNLCKKSCFGPDSADCKRDCDDKFRSCKSALFPSCSYADKQGAVTADNTCLSLDNYQELSKELFLGSGWLSFSNPALEQNCPDGCSYYTQTIQRVFSKEAKAVKSRRQKTKKTGKKRTCSDSYVIVHCGPKKLSSDYNLNIREIKNLCTDFNPAGCTVY